MLPINTLNTLYPPPSLEQKIAIALSDISPSLAKAVAVAGTFFSICVASTAGVAACIGVVIGLTSIGILAADAITIGFFVGFLVMIIIGPVPVVFFSEIHEEANDPSYGNDLLIKQGNVLDQNKLQAFTHHGKYCRILNLSTLGSDLAITQDDLLGWLKSYIPPQCDNNDMKKYQEFYDAIEKILNNYNTTNSTPFQITTTHSALHDLCKYLLEFKSLIRDPKWIQSKETQKVFNGITYNPIKSWDLEWKPIEAVMKSCPKLKELNLGNFLTPKILETLKKMELESLSFDLTQVSEDDKHLNFSYFLFNGKNAKERLVEIAQHLPSTLTQLTLEGTLIDPDNLPVEFFKELIKQCPNLKVLELPECNHKILKVVSELPELEKLQIRTNGRHFLLKEDKNIRVLKRAERLKKIYFFATVSAPALNGAVPTRNMQSLKDEFKVIALPREICLSR